MIFKTVTDSLYEVDRENSRIRRVTGNREPTKRQGSDGEWREYENITDVGVGGPVLIHWKHAQPVVAGALPCTLTSPVKEIIDAN